MADVLDLAKKRASTFLEFSHGSSPTFVRYVDEDEDVTFEGNVYSAQPNFEIDLAAHTGFLEEDLTVVVMPLDSFTELLSNGQPHAKVSIRIVVVLESDTPGSPADQVLEMFKGTVTIAIRNYQRKAGRVGFKCATWKHDCARATGIPATKECAWRFQGYGCVVPDGVGGFTSTVTPSSPATQAPTLLTISLNKVTVDAVAGAPFLDLLGNPTNLFHRGFMEFDDLKIGIRKWATTTPLDFHMEKPPPDNWIGQVVTLHQGCDKSVDTCFARYLNNKWFGGMGIRIPDYHPIFEQRE